MLCREPRNSLKMRYGEQDSEERTKEMRTILNKIIDRCIYVEHNVLYSFLKCGQKKSQLMNQKDECPHSLYQDQYHRHQ